MQEKDELLDALMSGKTIKDISYGMGSAAFRCDDERSLTLYALADVCFDADDVAERLDAAPIKQKLDALTGQTINWIRVDAMGDYCMRLGEFAVLRFGKGRSYSGETLMIADSGKSTMRL